MALGSRQDWTRAAVRASQAQVGALPTVCSLQGTSGAWGQNKGVQEGRRVPKGDPALANITWHSVLFGLVESEFHSV